MPRSRRYVTEWLASAPTSVFTAYAIGAAFSTYFCMYAFRKPFSVATFDGQYFLGSAVALKTSFVISQILGYTASKFLGIKYCSEITRARRQPALIGLILIAHLSLLLFAVLPPNLKVVAIFFNGLPLGMVWGLTVRYLEGRRTSELLLAGLSVSFIVSSGVVKDVGRWLMSAHGVSEAWMPFATGLCFLPVYLLTVWLLDQLPEPNDEDVAERTLRESMDGVHRLAFFRHFLPGMALLLFVYFFLTAYRDFRDNFGVEIFTEMGYGDTPAIFTRTELPIALGVMVALATLNLLRDNRWGLVGTFALMTGGLVLMIGSSLLLDAGLVSGVVWMVLTGLGAYLAYVPYGSVLFDRIIASSHVVATAVYAIYICDAVGYTGSIAVQLYKDLFASEASRLEFFRAYTYFVAAVGAVLLVATCAYFLHRHARHAKAIG